MKWFLILKYVTLSLCFHGKRRIFGGYMARQGEMTHQAAVGFKSSSSEDVEIVCGGSIINPRYILTAAHCYDENLKMVVMVGSRRISPKRGQWLDIIDNVMPPKWIKGSFNYDLMLLKTADKISFRYGLTTPVELPMRDSNIPVVGSKLWTSGWGYVNRTTSSNKLKKINLEVISEYECLKVWSPEKTTRICCKSGKTGWGTCGGDSGGGLLYGRILIGILSYGTQDCSQNVPEVYVDLHPYIEWIHLFINE